MDLNLKGKAAVVTGASRGIGAGIARELAQEGVSVMLVGPGTLVRVPRGSRRAARIVSPVADPGRLPVELRAVGGLGDDGDRTDSALEVGAAHSRGEDAVGLGDVSALAERMGEEQADYPSIRYRPGYVALQDVERTAAERELVEDA